MDKAIEITVRDLIFKLEKIIPDSDDRKNTYIYIKPDSELWKLLKQVEV